MPADVDGNIYLNSIEKLCNSPAGWEYIYILNYWVSAADRTSPLFGTDYSKEDMQSDGSASTGMYVYAS